MIDTTGCYCSFYTTFCIPLLIWFWECPRHPGWLSSASALFVELGISTQPFIVLDLLWTPDMATTHNSAQILTYILLTKPHSESHCVSPFLLWVFSEFPGTCMALIPVHWRSRGPVSVGCCLWPVGRQESCMDVNVFLFISQVMILRAAH